MTKEEAVNKWIIPAIRNTWNDKKCEEIIKVIKSEPCEDKRLYIKVFADLEPDDIAEKIYQICDEDKFPKVIESLKEHFDSEPCEDCVSRIEALNSLDKVENKDSWYRLTDVMKMIRNLPLVNPQPKTGHWFIDERPESDRETICSNCEQPIFKYHKLDFDYRPKYCPNCGTKMIEPQESEG